MGCFEFSKQALKTSLVYFFILIFFFSICSAKQVLLNPPVKPFKFTGINSTPTFGISGLWLCWRSCGFSFISCNYFYHVRAYIRMPCLWQTCVWHMVHVFCCAQLHRQIRITASSGLGYFLSFFKTVLSVCHLAACRSNALFLHGRAEA